MGSVRQVIDTDGDVANRYTYGPFGNIFAAETTETVENAFTFTGQWYDEEIGQYYLRARMYDPQLYRFTARDPYQGRFTEPLSLHPYLYCLNNPTNRIDPAGDVYIDLSMTNVLQMGLRGYNMYTTYRSVRGYAKQFASGVSMRNILLSASVEVGLNLASAKALDFFASAAPKVLNSVGQAIKYERHHVFPKFLAGFDTLITHRLKKSAHTQFHQKLLKKLLDEFGLEKGAKVWSTRVWQNFLKDGNNYQRMIGVLWETTSEFGDTAMLGDLLESLMQNMK